jgi:hypothetical protein
VDVHFFTLHHSLFYFDDMFNSFNSYSLFPGVRDMSDFNDLASEDLNNFHIRSSLFRCLRCLLAFAIGIGICILLSCCTTPRVIEQHHHHQYEADTLALQSVVDSRIQSWHAQINEWFLQTFSQYNTSSSSSEEQRETVTETVTISLDSLGRELRTEQRVIKRSIYRELQQQEQHIKREYEQRIVSVVDSLNTEWNQRLEAMQACFAQIDSTAVSKTPVGGNRSWYRCLIGNTEWLALLAVLLIVIFLIFVNKYKTRHT